MKEIKIYMNEPDWCFVYVKMDYCLLANCEITSSLVYIYV